MTSANRHQPDYVFLGLVAVLVIFGLVMLSSASAVLGFQRFGDSNYFLKKQSLSVLVGLVAFMATYRIDYHHWRKLAVPLMIGTVGLLMLVFIPGLGTEILGARRWIRLGSMLFQPSELAKLTFLFYLAAWFERRDHVLGRMQEGLMPFLITLGAVAGLVLLQPDLGTTIIIVLMSVSVYFAAGGSFRHLMGLGAIGGLLLFLAIKTSKYRADRLTVFLNPDIDPQGIGYHIRQAWLAIGSGGWFGLGLGHSRQKFNYLPEPAGDSIFAVAAEELGFLFVILFVLTWLVLILRGLRIARHAPDRFGQLVAIGITVWLGWQTFLNIGALSGLLPLTGIPLPFMSHGGSAMIVSLAAVGVMMNISRQTTRQLRRS
ncbi:MAG: putative lipid II flippase FtsW [Patescibacteria group bacterium]